MGLMSMIFLKSITYFLQFGNKMFTKPLQYFYFTLNRRYS